MRHDDLIAAYAAAFQRANGKPFKGVLAYERGWFIFRWGGIETRYRRKQLEDMRERLAARPPLSREGV